MNENEIRKLYSEEIESSAPDMDALWSRIESSLAEKSSPDSAVTDSKPARRKAPFITLKKGLAFAAACAVLAVVLPTARIANIKNAESSTGSAEFIYEQAKNASDNGADPSYAAPDAESAETGDAQESVDMSDGGMLYYSELALAPSGQSVPYTGEGGNGGEYFFEEDILIETEYFIDAVVDKVYASADGKAVYYELKASSVYSSDGSVTEGETLIVSSRSKYGMLAGREYLIPVKSSEEGLRTVFDGVPQTEITLDGGMVYYNGWTSLDSDKSLDILYPQSGADDFFYDRMKFSYGGYTALLEKWRALTLEE